MNQNGRDCAFSDVAFSDGRYPEIDTRDDHAESNRSVHCIGELEKGKGIVGSRRNVFSLGLYGCASYLLAKQIR